MPRRSERMASFGPRSPACDTGLVLVGCNKFTGAHRGPTRHEPTSESGSVQGSKCAAVIAGPSSIVRESCGAVEHGQYF